MKRISVAFLDSSDTFGNAEEVMDLLPPMRAQFSRSKQLWYLGALTIGLGVYLAALLASSPLGAPIVGSLAILTFLAQVSAFMLRRTAVNYYNDGERIRRMVMLKDGLGLVPSPAQLAKLKERTADTQTTEARLDRPYYESEEPEGLRRLLDIVSLATFFTGALARRTWKILVLIAICGLGIPVALLLVAALHQSSESGLALAARVFIASMAFWATGDVATMAVQFFQLSLNADRLHDQCERLLEQETPKTTDALLVFNEYSCAVVQSPPIPFWVYSRYREKLNLAWGERKNALQEKVAAR